MMIEGKDYEDAGDYDFVLNETVSPDYFEALGISILEGRSFLETDTLQDPDDPNREEVIVITKAAAEKFWPGESPIGKRMKDSWTSDMPWNRVVGVIPNIVTDGYGSNPEDSYHIYRPSTQTAERGRTIFIKTQGDPQALIPTISKVIQEVNPDIVFNNPKTVHAQLEENQRGLNTMTQIFAITGVVALLLAAVGIYGVVSFSTQQRTREFGIRIALGATSWNILRKVVLQGMIQIVIGLICGLLLGVVLLLGLRTTIDFGSMWDPGFYLLPLAMITAVAVLAILLPASRASRITPMEALRDL